MLHAVIMAGGSGTRFWPASRANLPKQLLNLMGGRTMLQTTVDRLGTLVPAERLLIVTAERLVPTIAEQLPKVPLEAIVGEPCRRDTAPCIGLAAVLVRHHDPQATMAVFPSDHVISPDEVFQQTLADAAKLVQSRADSIVTFGIKPSYAAESFGYIERGRELSGVKVPRNTYQVQRFREKPQAATAREYLAAGNFYWNSGIFVWQADTILTALAQHRPALHERLMTIAAAIGTSQYAEVLRREFTAIEPVSIDYAVMEQHPDVLVIEAPFAWDDLGSWQAISRLRGSDAQGNTIVGRHIGSDTSGSIVRTDDQHLVATLGMRDCIVIHTPDATLVANKHDEEAIRKLVKILEENGWQHYL